MPHHVSRWCALIVMASSLVCAATVDPVQVIIDDMTLPPDAALHGTEALDWGTGAAGTPTSVPNKNYKGEWFEAMTNWGQVYIPRAGSTAINTRCQIRNLTSKLLRKNGTWEIVQSGDPQGAAFRENFANNESKDAGIRNESANGGGVSMIVGVNDWAGFNFHFWSTGSRAVVDVTNTVAVFTTCEARLIINNPSLPDDRASCKNLLQMGGDWWLNQSGGWLPDWSANSGICGGRAKWVTSEWQSFSMCTLTPTQIRATPPVAAVIPNQTPTVTVSAPATATVGSSIALSATAADSDGSIASVEFYVGSTLLASDSSSPYAASWTPSVAGSYAVTAKANDNLGATTVSAIQTVVVSVAGTGPGTGTGLTATYFSDMTLTNSVVTRTDATIDFDWGSGAPASGVGADGFSARWTGHVQAQFSETYTFTTLSDDGVRLWVNGQQLVNNWTDHGPTENSATIALVAGQKYDLKMEFYEKGGGAVAKLSWASPSTAKQIIPMTQLFPSQGTPGGLPAGWAAQDVGSVSVAGSTTYDNGTWTVTGSGADIWGSADGCRFASLRVTGDVQVTAQVSGLTNTNEWAKAGVTIRESLTIGSRHASTFATVANGLAYQRRVTTDGASSHTAGPGNAAPYWVRIERLGNVVISSTSPNGTTWTEIRRETITMSAAVYVGLAVTSHNNGVLCTGTFTNVQVVGVAAAAN